MAHHGKPRIRSWSSLLLFIIGAHARLALMATRRSSPYETWCGDLLPLQFALCLQASFVTTKLQEIGRTASRNCWRLLVLKIVLLQKSTGFKFQAWFLQRAWIIKPTDTIDINHRYMMSDDVVTCCNSLTLLNYTGHPCVTVQYQVSRPSHGCSIANPIHVYLQEMQNSWDCVHKVKPMVQ